MSCLRSTFAVESDRAATSQPPFPPRGGEVRLDRVLTSVQIFPVLCNLTGLFLSLQWFCEQMNWQSISVLNPRDFRFPWASCMPGTVRRSLKFLCSTVLRPKRLLSRCVLSKIGPKIDDLALNSDIQLRCCAPVISFTEPVSPVSTLFWLEGLVSRRSYISNWIGLSAYCLRLEFVGKDKIS